GEIYNYLELLDGLEQQGHQFATKSDTETLVHLYESQGDHMTEALRGMFAFCIYDQPKGRYFFARDRFGEKPFFYHFKDGVFSYSSELASLLENEAIDRRLNKEAFHYFLKAGMVPEPLTLFQDIYILPAGHQLVVDQHGVQVHNYFEVDYQADPGLKTEEDAADYLRPLLEQAVRRQMRSDVPLGAFLSGGIDSSTVVALLAKFAPKQVNTFTVRFEDSSYDESPIAREVAAFVGSNHHEITVPNADFDESLFWMIIDHTGVPFTDTSAIPSYLITKEIRKHVTVALSGDGGDELFAGYPLFQWWSKIHRLKQVPAPLRSMGLQLANLGAKLPAVKNVSLVRQLSKALDVSFQPSAVIPYQIQELLDDDSITRMYTNGAMPDYERLKAFWEPAQHWSPLRQIMYFRLKYNLPLNMLVKVDRMSMANSLEVRAPFLDPDLFEASTRVPDAFLIKDGVGKHIVRKIMEKDLPDSVFNHPKMGFAIPMHRYQNENYRNLANRLIRKDHPLAELLSMEEIEQLKYVGFVSQKDTAQLSVYKANLRLWALMALFGWFDHFKVRL
ncbi:MAG: asparagine synthase (glutamine-hydrolyzing), partial [Phaeodactylibacter sp.]|nr:asparagine synthase (glutamine-hydrolyzing) [Phaeodactylibacter sp.]